MDIRILKDKKNALLNRRELDFVVKYEGSTPSWPISQLRADSSSVQERRFAKAEGLSFRPEAKALALASARCFT